MLPGLRPGPGRERRAPSCCTEAGELTRAVTRPDPLPPPQHLDERLDPWTVSGSFSEVMSYVHEAAFLSSERAGKVAQAGVGAGGLNHLGPFRVYPGNKRGTCQGVFGPPVCSPQTGGLPSERPGPGGPPGTLDFAAVTAANKHSRVRPCRVFSELEFERCFPFSQPMPSVLSCGSLSRTPR